MSCNRGALICLLWWHVQLLLWEEEWRGVYLELAASLCGILLRRNRLDWLRYNSVTIGDTTVIVCNRGNFAIDDSGVDVVDL